MSKDNVDFEEYIEKMAVLKKKMLELREEYLHCTGGVIFSGLTDSSVEVRLENVCPYPGGRYIQNGPYSGEFFRDFVLVPLFRTEGVTKVTVHMDGVPGTCSSWLDEAFGYLDSKTQLTPEQILSKIEVVTECDDLRSEIREFLSSDNSL